MAWAHSSQTGVTQPATDVHQLYDALEHEIQTRAQRRATSAVVSPWSVSLKAHLVGALGSVDAFQPRPLIRSTLALFDKRSSSRIRTDFGPAWHVLHRVLDRIHASVVDARHHTDVVEGYEYEMSLVVAVRAAIQARPVSDVRDVFPFLRRLCVRVLYPLTVQLRRDGSTWFVTNFSACQAALRAVERLVWVSEEILLHLRRHRSRTFEHGGRRPATLPPKIRPHTTLPRPLRSRTRVRVKD